MSKTPRTDALVKQFNDWLAKPGGEKAFSLTERLIDLARECEADLAAARAECERLREALQRVVAYGCASDGWDASVALELCAWIKAGMKDDLPPLPMGPDVLCWCGSSHRQITSGQGEKHDG